MKKYSLLIALAIVIGAVSSSFIFADKTNEEVTISEVVDQSGLEWFSDFQKANEVSKKTGKPIFGFFTGSDWCGWCTRLKQNVFSKAAFIKWAKEEVILVELDFPRRTQLPANIVKQNRELAQLFKVRGYPTVWIFNTVKNAQTKQVSINAWGSTGYPQGAVAGKEELKFLADMERIFATQKK